VVDLNARSTSVDDFCSTILANPAKFAELVRSFDIVGSGLRFFGDRSLLSDCIKTLRRIENLSIPHPIQREVLTCTFPHLARCTVRVEDGRSPDREDMVASFLARHQALKSICILDGFEAWSSTSARIPLLNLERIWAPVAFVTTIITGDLKYVHLHWEDTDPVEPTFTRLRSMTRSDIPFICSNDCDDHQFAPIMDSVSRNIPHTKTLHFAIEYRLPHSRDETIAQFKACLPRFTALVYFAIQSDYEGLSFGKTEAEDQITMQSLGNLCPTLQACCLNGVAWRKLNGPTWEKFPKADFSVLAGVDIDWVWVLSRVLRT